MSPLIAERCGNAVPAPIASSANSMWIRFTSDDIDDGSTKTGFQATFQQRGKIEYVKPGEGLSTF